MILVENLEKNCENINVIAIGDPTDLCCELLAVILALSDKFEKSSSCGVETFQQFIHEITAPESELWKEQ